MTPTPTKHSLRQSGLIMRYPKAEARSVHARTASEIAPNRHAVHPFDATHGTDTGGYLTPQEVAAGREHDALNYGYSAIAPSVFRAALARWQDTLPGAAKRLSAYTFVDVGAGKGRALLLAAEVPFRKVVGVELNEELARIARRNAARQSALARPRAKIRVMHADALEFRWPRTPLLVYLYNPFACELVEQLAAKLADAATPSASGLVDLLYVNPTCADALSRQGKFSLLWTARIEMDQLDQQADPYGTTWDRVSAYRLRR
jgi:SAM-dependent methyltransferase